MTGSKILVIDDHYEVQDFLRSMLELASDTYAVHCVPSAEEGWLELLQVRFDLLITDLRLPGMGGFELARMAQKRFPALPIILISGNDSEENQQEAAALNSRLFSKPLDTAELMKVVVAALDNGAPPPQGAESKPPPADPAAALPPVLVRRIDNLLAETGAAQVLLVTPEGVIRHSAGHAPDVPLPAIVANACGVISRAMQLGAYLAPEGPATLQYHRGTSHDLYSASVGEQYVLLALVKSQTRRARVGTVWIFFQRAVNDILAHLADLARLEATVPAGLSDLAITRPLGAAKERTPEAPPPPAETDAAEAAEDVQTSVQTQDVQTQDVQTQDVQTQDVVEAPADDEAVAVLQDLLSEPEPEAEVRTRFDDFWDSAIEEDLTAADSGNGLTLEEALRQGLLPEDFGPEPGDV